MVPVRIGLNFFLDLTVSLRRKGEGGEGGGRAEQPLYRYSQFFCRFDSFSRA